MIIFLQIESTALGEVHDPVSNTGYEIFRW